MRIIITGASSGLGLASAEAFAKDGHNILMLARGEQRLNQAAEELKSKYPLAAIEAQVLDVSDFDQIRDFAKQQTKSVDVLMNNAGLMGQTSSSPHRALNRRWQLTTWDTSCSPTCFGRNWRRIAGE